MPTRMFGQFLNWQSFSAALRDHRRPALAVALDDPAMRALILDGRALEMKRADIAPVDAVDGLLTQ